MLQFSIRIFTDLFRKSCVEVVEMTDEDSNERMESVEDLIGTESSEEEITVGLKSSNNNFTKYSFLGGEFFDC